MTSEQIKLRFSQEGMTFKQWAEKNNFPLNEVYRVLNGQCKARYGKGHAIAVKLGMKSDSSLSATA